MFHFICWHLILAYVKAKSCEKGQFGKWMVEEHQSLTGVWQIWWLWWLKATLSDVKFLTQCVDRQSCDIIVSWLSCVARISWAQFYCCWLSKRSRMEFLRVVPLFWAPSLMRICRGLHDFSCLFNQKQQCSTIQNKGARKIPCENSLLAINYAWKETKIDGNIFLEHPKYA